MNMNELRLSEFTIDIGATKGNCVYCTKKVDMLSIVKLVYKNDWLDETTTYYVYLCDKCRMSQIDEVRHVEFKSLIALLKMKPHRRIEKLSFYTDERNKSYAFLYTPKRYNS